MFTDPTRQQLIDRTALTLIRRQLHPLLAGAGHSDRYLLEKWGERARPAAEFLLFSVGEIIRPELDRLYRRAS